MQKIKVLVFVVLFAIILIPTAINDVAQAEQNAEIKYEDIKTENDAKKYYSETESKITAIYHDLKLSHDMSKAHKYQELKDNIIALMAEYSPDENPSSYTVDEWFDYLAGVNEHSTMTVGYYVGDSITYTVGSGSVVAQIGYKAPCNWAPIFTCDTDIGSSSVVSTSYYNGISFIGHTHEDNSWITPYYKMSPAVLWKTYSGSGDFIITQPSGAITLGISMFNEYAYYPGIVFQKYVQTVGNSCSCNTVSENTSIQINITLDNVS